MPPTEPFTAEHRLSLPLLTSWNSHDCRLKYRSTITFKRLKFIYPNGLGLHEAISRLDLRGNGPFLNQQHFSLLSQTNLLREVAQKQEAGFLMLVF